MVTVAHQLDRLGHDVTLFADELGPFADELAEAGYDVVRGPEELPAECDAVLANDRVSAGLLAERYRGVRLVYCIHGGEMDVALPPLADGCISAIVAPSERFAAYARALAVDVPVVRLTQPIDTDRFAMSAPPRQPPQTALLLGSYLHGGRRDALVEVWTEAGIDCVQVGHPTGAVFDVRADLASADIVVAKGRAALEGMACGKAVYVFDAYGGDGWVTGDSYARFEADNFSGQASARPVDRRRLRSHLDSYDPDMGWINRELVITHHHATHHAVKLVEVLRGPAADGRDPTTSTAAMARMARMGWRVSGRARALEHELGIIRADRDSWQARAARAEGDLESLRAQIDTRRVRAGLAIGRLLDRLRGRR